MALNHSFKDAAIGQFNVNLLAMINVSQVVANSLLKAGRGGSIVNISSVASRIGSSRDTTIYGVTKAGVENLTKSMAVELGRHNIRVNALAPGMVNTPMLLSALSGPHAMDEATSESFKQRVINKRMIEPNEIADLAMFLLSLLSSMIIGETVVIDGGLMAS